MKRYLLAFCWSLLIFPLTAQNNPSLQEAMANYDYEKALVLIEQEQHTIALLYQKGKALKGLGRNAEALQAYQAIIQKDSLQLRSYLEMAECYKALAKYDQALQNYRKAILLNPQHKYARMQYINLLLALKRHRESLAESEQLVQQDSSAYALHLRAESMEHCYTNADILKVIEAYQDIHNRYPEDYLSAAKLGNIFVAGRQYKDAIDITEQFRHDIDSTNIVINRINAQAYCLNQDYTIAINRYEKLLQEGDSTFQTLFYAGISYYANNQFYEVHDLLEKALQEDPTNINVLYYLGRACAKTSWKKEGVEHLEKAIALSVPNDSVMSRLYTGLADSYKMARRYKEQADALITQYNEYDSDKHHLLYNAAFIYCYRLKDLRQTEKYLKAYLKTRPTNMVQEMDADGNPIISENNRYNAAEVWLKDLQKQRKEENFFKGQIDSTSISSTTK